MARYASIATTVAATALIAVPVLAQNAAPGSNPPSPPAFGPTHPASPGTGMNRLSGANAGSRAAASQPIYFTADHQLRTSKLVGASVYNDQNQSIGSIDDVLMSNSDHKAATAVIAVGGFLGIGAKLVSVPFDQLKISDTKVEMPGATKASLQGMPEFHYGHA